MSKNTKPNVSYGVMGDWIRKLTKAPGAFQKNDNLVKLEDYHNEVRDICNDAGVLTSNLM